MNTLLSLLIMIFVLVGGFGILIGGPGLAMKWEKKILTFISRHTLRLGKKLLRFSGKKLVRLTRSIWVRLKA